MEAQSLHLAPIPEGLGMGSANTPVPEERLSPPVTESVRANYEPLHQLVRLTMLHPGRPSFTEAVLSDIRSIVRWARAVIDWRPTGTGPGGIRYLVLDSAHPGVFNNGGDLARFIELIRAHDRGRLLHYAELCLDCQFERYVFPVPTISLVRGSALGGGFECALADDLIIAERGAKFALPEVAIGLWPGMGALSFLFRRVGMGPALEMVRSGRTCSVDELHEMGVVDVVAEGGEGEETLQDFLSTHDASFNSNAALCRAVRCVNPVTRDELDAVAEQWVDAALSASERDLQTMEKLCALQDRRMSRIRRAGLPKGGGS